MSGSVASRRKEISVPFNSGDSTRIVGTEIAPGLVLHRIPGRNVHNPTMLMWRVVHEKTGRVICAFHKIATAWEFGKRINGLTDWSQDAGPIKAEQAALVPRLASVLCDLVPPPDGVSQSSWFWRHQPDLENEDWI